MYIRILIAIFLLLVIFLKAFKPEILKSISRVAVKVIRIHYRFYSIMFVVSIVAYFYTVIFTPELITINMILFAISIVGMIVHIEGIEPYTKGHWLYRWHEWTYRIMGADWGKEIYRLLKSNNLISPAAPSFVFVSPSANKGTYEKEIFRETNKDRNNNLFIISDIVQVDGHEENETINNSTFMYCPPSDATYIDTFLKSLSISKVNIIWDFKGCIWHKIENQDIEGLKLALENYSSVLDPGSCIIFDNIKPKLYFLNALVWNLSLVMIGLCEFSTGGRIRNLMKSKDPLRKEITEFINSNFNIKYLKGKNYKENLMVLIKK
jgi:hypothetical protein